VSTDSSLVAPVVSTDEWWRGASLADGVEDLVDTIRGEGWVDPLLAGVTLGLDVVSSIIDPFSALLANGLGWAMEYFDPLSSILDDLTGMPDVIASHAATWDNMATELLRMSEDLRSHVGGDIPGWTGPASEAYQKMMSYNVDALGGMAGISVAMGSATAAAGNLVAFTRDIVRDLIADLVARVIVWAVEAFFVVTIPVIAAQIVAAVVKWLGRIITYVTALIMSLTNLSKLVG
jgi:uncharacterized protein YukE